MESEIDRVHNKDLPRDKFPYIKDPQDRLTKINIGYLSEIKNRSKCELCAYLWSHLSKLNIYTKDGRSKGGDYNVVCLADIGRQDAVFRYPEIDSNDTITLFRLAFTTHLEGHPYHDTDNITHLVIDNHFQTCNVGAGSIQVDESFRDPRTSMDMAVFGGRRRPEQININWLRRWLNICENNHGDEYNALLSTAEIFRQVNLHSCCLA